MPDPRFSKLVVFVNSVVPAALLAWDAWRGRLGANPYEFATRCSGVLALLFLLLSLAVTPARKLLGQPWLARFRRTLGLFGFSYATLHLLTYVWFDKGFHLRAIVHDVGRRPFITIGMATFLLVLVLAATSPSWVIKRMGGKRWVRLHKLAYVAACGGTIHYYLLVKADTRPPLAFAAVVALLLGYRILNHFQPRFTERKPVRSARGAP
jgi:sulfoxide reductase heme-binding subunit YedZ